MSDVYKIKFGDDDDINASAIVNCTLNSVVNGFILILTDEDGEEYTYVEKDLDSCLALIKDYMPEA